MDAVQFGRWLHTRRRRCGFSSQRALAEHILQDLNLADAGISEAFLARLEAGQLVHPFRGDVRRRVLALAQLLCHTTRDVLTYLQVAELTDLDAREAEDIVHLRKRLSSSQQPIFYLPIRPRQVIGREREIEETITGLRQKHTDLFLITGMTGVGKSTLAAEVVHMLTNDTRQYIQTFQDGIISFSCKGYQGNKGLLILCEHILALFETRSSPSSRKPSVSKQDICLNDEKQDDDAAVSRAVNRVRLALAERTLLILLDDLDAQFPLRIMLEALSTHKQQHKILVTSRYHFAYPPGAFHIHLEPLSPSAALEYFVLLLRRSLNEEERNFAQKLCIFVGNLPVALESLVFAHNAGLPLSLLHESIVSRSLSPLLKYDHELYTRLEDAFTSLNEEQQKRYALLSMLDVPSLGIEWATTLHQTPLISCPEYSLDKKTSSCTTNTALEMGHFVHHSFVHLLQSPVHEVTQIRYQLHPVLRAYGQHYLQKMEPERLDIARGSINAYALTYLEQHNGAIQSLLRERDILFACFTNALHAERYTDVVRFVNGLTPISCRLHNRENGNHLFLMGIQASKYLHDREQQVRFMHSFGWLCCHWGALADATRIWIETLELNTDATLNYWQPLLSLAHLAHLQHEEVRAVQYVERYLHYARDSATQLQHVHAYTLLALYKRLQSKHDDADAALTTATKLLDAHNFTQRHSVRYFLEKHLHIEQARLMGNYTSAQENIEMLAAFLEQEEEHYDLANLLLEQAEFAIHLGVCEQVPVMVQRSVRAAEQVDATYLRQLALPMAQCPLKT